MKTSHQQFEMLITYMEQYGDLSKPATDGKGRIATLKHWEDLTTLLNSNGSGHTKTTEKWKKAWSDFKNNSKKKAARLQRAACGSGGPKVYSKLTDLEQRVLNLIGVQFGPSLAVEKAEFLQDVKSEPSDDVEPVDVDVIILGSQVEENGEHWNLPEPSSRPHLSPDATPNQNNQNIEEREDLSSLGCTSSSEDTGSAEQPASSGQTVSHGLAQSVTESPQGLKVPLQKSRRRLPRRLMRPPDAAQHFINCDREWREFRIQQHRDKVELQREQNRIREMELESQREWREIAIHGLNILERFMNNFNRDIH